MQLSSASAPTTTSSAKAYPLPQRSTTCRGITQYNEGSIPTIGDTAFFLPEKLFSYFCAMDTLWQYLRRYLPVKLLLPLLFIAYAGSTSLFPHVHIIDGCKIVHSHPYSNGHTHSGKTAQTILFLSLFTLDTDIIQSGLPPVFLHLCRLVAAPSVPDAPVRFFIHSETRRGPPAIF